MVASLPKDRYAEFGSDPPQRNGNQQVDETKPFKTSSVETDGRDYRRRADSWQGKSAARGEVVTLDIARP